MNKWGYIFAHLAIIVICVGGLIDCNLLLKIGMLTGKIEPDATSMFAKDFKPESTLSANNLSFRGDVNIVEGQTVDVVFLNADSAVGAGFAVSGEAKNSILIFTTTVCRAILPAMWW